VSTPGRDEVFMNLKERAPVPRGKVRRALPKDVAKVVLGLMDDGWVVVEAGHKYKLLCPCEDFVAISVGGTIRNPTWAARTIAKDAEACSSGHERLRHRYPGP
jgi:hypothetical protein